MNLHIVRNSVSHDSRVLKETATASSLGFFDRIEIAGFHEEGLSVCEDIADRSIWRARLRSRSLPKNLLSQSVKYAEWYFQLIKRYGASPLKLIHCHDLEPLPISVRLKKMTGAKLVYDAHELETEVFGLTGLRQRLAREIEKSLIDDVDALITVSPSIQHWYREKYPAAKVELIRNIPEQPVSEITPRPLRNEFGVADDAFLFIYLGVIANGRGIDLLLNAFMDEGVKHHVVFMGDGPLKERIKVSARKCDRVHYLPPVEPTKVLEYAAGADVGLSMIEDACLSYRYCLPNKLFESLMSNMPVLVSGLPDQTALVNDYDAGWVASGLPDLLLFLRQINQEQIEDKKNGLSQRVQDLNWSSESEKLKVLYKTLLGSEG